MSQHTPGPWFAEGATIYHEGGLACVAVAESGCAPGNGTRDAQLANARLIAAAPDLLAALSYLVRESDPDLDDDDKPHAAPRTLALTAIKKATGDE